MKIAIIGVGWVGEAMDKLFDGSDQEVMLYHPDRNNKEEVEKQRKTANEANIAFICVPTPVIGEGKLDTSIVEGVISWLEVETIVVRSTVNPGDCDRWALKYLKNIVFQPEYLGETPEHPLLDTKKTPFLIIGGHYSNRKKLIDLYTQVYNANVNIRQVSNYEAEVIKLTENRAIAFKVAQAQELYDVCEKIGLDYYTIRDAVYGDDPRFNLWWTFVYPEKRGFNSKCIPKDIYAWCAWAESLGYKPEITRAILEKNKEWINDKI